MAKTDTKYDILEAGAEIIWRKGFNNTGIQEILKSAGVPKGSFYFYFDNKNDFGIELIEVFAGMLKYNLTRILQDEELHCKEKLKKFFRGQNAIIEKTEFTAGCPIGNLVQEMAGLDERFRLRLLEVLTSLTEDIAECMRKGMEKNEIKQYENIESLADFIIDSWEGAVMRAKLMKSTKPFENFEYYIFKNLI